MEMTPLILSLKAAAVATVLVILTGIPVSYLAARMKRGKSIVDVICTLPMVLPPTVVGFFLLLLFGKNSMLGAWLMAHGIPVVFSQTGMVIASAVVSFPLLYRTARGAFEQMDETLVYAAFSASSARIVCRAFWQALSLHLQEPWENSEQRSCWRGTYRAKHRRLQLPFILPCRMEIENWHFSGQC